MITHVCSECKAVYNIIEYASPMRNNCLLCFLLFIKKRFDDNLSVHLHSSVTKNPKVFHKENLLDLINEVIVPRYPEAKNLTIDKFYTMIVGLSL